MYLVPHEYICIYVLHRTNVNTLFCSAEGREETFVHYSHGMSHKNQRSMSSREFMQFFFPKKRRRNCMKILKICHLMIEWRSKSMAELITFRPPIILAGLNELIEIPDAIKSCSDTRKKTRSPFGALCSNCLFMND